MPELRKDPITGRWVIISSDRGKRPTDFAEQRTKKRGGFCPFCAGNERTTPPEILAYREGGQPNSPGWRLRVVPNKFPALQIEGEPNKQGEGIFDKMNGLGAHEVIIENPDHNASLASLPSRAMEEVLWAYRDRMEDLKKDRRFQYTLIFKNEGLTAGATLEHSHSQLIALPIVPIQVQEEIDGCRKHYDLKERCIFCDIIRQELQTRARVVMETHSFVALAPFAPRFPFETWIMPKRHISCFSCSTNEDFKDLAFLLQNTLRRLDKALSMPPYNYIIHTSPFKEEINDYYHWHIELMPKLTNVAGFEWGSGFYINPTPPEEAAKFLREIRL
ncbi:MAG: galactose-phosphate uridylyltransferase [Nitrospirae bacterium]|jgi:UDPglucose--hexose-1-phosphate uridylyltransferase|nr:galactose-phosphate uridylyltransferase [Nitrospirota bacterium]